MHSRRSRARHLRPVILCVFLAVRALALTVPVAAAGGAPLLAGAPPPAHWPTLQEQLQADHVAPGSALAKLIADNQEFTLLRPEESRDQLRLPPWIRVLWRTHHPNDRYLASDPSGGYPRLLRNLHQWMITHQDLKPAAPPAAVPVDRSAAESGEKRISGAQTSARSESMIRINRGNTQQVIAASNEIAGNTGQAQFYSADQGATWGQVSLALVGNDYFQSDPSVDWTSDGTAWTTTIGVDANVTTLTLHAFKSTNGGATWTYDADFNGSYTGNDKDMMWVDHSATSPYKDHIYAIWHSGYPAIVARRTGPGGSWQTPVQVSGAETTGTAIGGDVKTNAYGDVFAFYPDTGSQGIYVAKSTNGGASFGTPVQIGTTYGSFQLGIPADDYRGALIYTSAAAYRTAGANDVYVVWNDLSGDPYCTSGLGPGLNASSSCKTRIYFSRSADGGATWSAAVKINDQPGVNDQFFPWLVVDDASGNLAVTYYDTAGDSTRASTNLYYQSSTNGGLSWSAPFRVTSAATNENTNGTDFGNQYGDYTGLDGFSGLFFPSWTDRRGGGYEEIWTAAISDSSTGCTPPAAPSGLAAAPFGRPRINLSWNASSGATQYAILRSTQSGGPYSQVGTTSSTSFADYGPMCGTTYYYVVTAGNGTCASAAASNQAQATTAACLNLACTTAPLYQNNFETGSGQTDWGIGSFGSGNTADWQGIQACSAHSGTHVFRFGGATCTSGYGANDFVFSVPQGGSGITVPDGGLNNTLSFWHRYDFASGTDGASLAVSVDGFYYYYVPSSAIASGASYNGTLGGACSPPYSAGAPIFTGTQSSFVNTTVNLDPVCNIATGGSSGCSGQPLYIAFIGLSGCAPSGAGWFLDDVTVTSCETPTPLNFYTVTPCRVFDTRTTSPLVNGTRNFQVAGLCGVPANARAVSANLTIVGPQGPGYLTVYPGDAALPPTSSINFRTGQVRANNAVASLAQNGNGTINVFAAIAGGPSNTVNFVFDVFGYYQ